MTLRTMRDGVGGPTQTPTESTQVLNHPTTRPIHTPVRLPSFVVNRCKDDFREFVDTLVVALRGMEQTENPVAHIHPVLVHEGLTPIAEIDTHDSR